MSDERQRRDGLHPLLGQQLRSAGLSADAPPPSAEGWRRFLELVDCAYSVGMRDEFVALRDAKASADASNRAKSAFLASMSHELRTPLNAILGFSDLLAMELVGPLNEVQREYIDNVSVSGRHLLELVNEVLDLSKIEAGRLELLLTWVPASSLIHGVLREVAGLALARAVEFTIEGAEGSPDIYVDPVRMRQVLFNLLSNAVRFSPARGRVRVQTTFEDDLARIAVSDSGPGIREEDIHRLFKAYEQIESSGDFPGQGTGLGLTLSRRLVEMQGGTLVVASVHGQGATFTIELPLRPKYLGSAVTNRSTERPLGNLLAGLAEEL